MDKHIIEVDYSDLFWQTYGASYAILVTWDDQTKGMEHFIPIERLQLENIEETEIHGGTRVIYSWKGKNWHGCVKVNNANEFLSDSEPELSQQMPEELQESNEMTDTEAGSGSKKTD